LQVPAFLDVVLDRPRRGLIQVDKLYTDVVFVLGKSLGVNNAHFDPQPCLRGVPGWKLQTNRDSYPGYLSRHSLAFRKQVKQGILPATEFQPAS
jgi:hypothetical protein